MFPFRLAAYLCGDDGVFVMTNSDARSLLADEIAVTAVEAYGWSGLRTANGGPVGLPADVRGRYVGTYVVAETEIECEVELEGRALALTWRGGQCGAVGAPRRRALQKYYRGRLPKPPLGLMPA